MKTIYVVFTDKQLTISKTVNLEHYAFWLDNYDIMYKLKVGDIITDKRYSTPMQVVNIVDAKIYILGVTMKTIEIETINNIPYSKPNNNKMETRNVSITLDQAREWYNSGNPTLRTLALNAFTVSELELDYDSIIIRLNNMGRTTCLCNTVTVEDSNKLSAYVKLLNLAAYFNGTWRMRAGATGYFIGKLSGNAQNLQKAMAEQGMGIYQHNTVHYAGIVYFRNAADALKAGKMLGDEIQQLFI